MTIMFLASRCISNMCSLSLMKSTFKDVTAICWNSISSRITYLPTNKSPSFSPKPVSSFTSSLPHLTGDEYLRPTGDFRIWLDHNSTSLRRHPISPTSYLPLLHPMTLLFITHEVLAFFLGGLVKRVSDSQARHGSYTYPYASHQLGETGS